MRAFGGGARGCAGDSSASDSDEDSAGTAAGAGAGAARRGPAGAVKMDFGPSTPGRQGLSFFCARAGDAPGGGGRLWRLSALGGGADRGGAARGGGGGGGGGGAGTA